MPTTKKKDCYCLSKEEYEALIGKKTKAKAKKTVKKTAKKPVKAKCTPCKATAPKKTVKVASKPKRTAKKKTTTTKTTKKMVVKTKRNVNRNVNNNAISVNVSSNPRAVSNVYLITPPQQMPAPVLEAPKKKVDRHIPYDAPFLRRRDGSPPRISTPRITNKTVYIDRPAAIPQIIVESANQPIPEMTAKKGIISRLSSKRTAQLSAPSKASRTMEIAEPKQEVLPPADSGYYLPPAREIQLENCESIKNPVEKSACKKRRRKAVSE